MPDSLDRGGRALAIDGARRRLGMPMRIVRQSTKGWKAPTGAVFVGRGSRWSNPFKVGAQVYFKNTPAGLRIETDKAEADAMFKIPNAAIACQLYRHWLGPEQIDRARSELRGRDLICRCSPDEPCHADVLLEIANDNSPFLNA